MTPLIEFTIEWAATFFVIMGAALTSADIYPLNLIAALLGNIGWIVMGMIWKKRSIVSLQVFMAIIYIIGLLKHHFH